MKIIIIYDNEVWEKGLEPDWGFSCIVEVDDRRILFDTGGNGRILLSNMEKLSIDPKNIDEVFISHAHWDHTGGLSDFLNVNKTAEIYVPPSFAMPTSRKVVTIKGRMKIHENIFSTGELEHIEQSMLVKTEKGIVVIAGCSHPKMRHILGTASQFGKVYALIGGLHGFREFELIKDLELICPTHRTQYKMEIKSLYPEKCVEGGAGKIISL